MMKHQTMRNRGGEKMKTQTFCFRLLLVLIISLACGPQFIDQPERTLITSDTNVRSGPGPNYKVIATAKAGTELFLLESENDWHRVQLQDGRTGWIFRGVSRTVGPEKIIILDDAQIRRGPGEEYKPFAVVKKGITLNSRGQRGSWYLVDMPDGKTGWISKQKSEKVSYRNITVNRKANIYQLPNRDSQVLLNVSSGTELIQLNREGDYYMVRLPGGSTGWIHKDDTGKLQEKTLVVKNRTYVRLGPTIGYDVVETVEQGARLTMLQEKDDWYKVRTPQGKTGWIYQDFITQSYAAPSTVPIEGSDIYLITNTDCNIRYGPGTETALIENVKKGTILLKIGQQENWLRVKMADSRIGWIREDLVIQPDEILVTVDRVSIRKGPSEDYIVQEIVSRGMPLAKIGEQANWSRIYLYNGEIGWVNNDFVVAIEQALFTNTDCNVREGAGTNYEQIDRLDKGTLVERISKQNNWYKVKLPSKKEGWIREDLLDENPFQLVTNERVNIRYGPSTDYKILMEVRKNTPVTVLKEQNNWYQVKLDNGAIGWIQSEYVSFSFYPIISNFQPNSNNYQPGSSDTQPSASSSIEALTVGTAIASSDQSDATMVTSSAVNLRIGPTTNDTEITTLNPGTSLTRINQQGDWYEVKTADGTYGFVHQSGFAPDPNKLYTNTKSNIRKGPDTDYVIATVLPANTELTKLDQRDNWIYVKTADNDTGWIREDLVETKSTPPPGDVQAEIEYGLLMSTASAPIRQGPDNDFPELMKVNINTELIKVGKYKNWYQVESISGDRGWVSKEFVKDRENEKIIVTRKAEVFQSPNTRSQLIDVIEVGEYFDPLDYKSGWYRISPKPGTAGYISSKNVKELKYPRVIVNTNSSEIKRFPDDRSARLAILQEGEILQPLDEREEWLFVQMSRGDKGWIKKNLVDRQKHPKVKIARNTQAYEEANAGGRTKASLYEGDSFFALDKKGDWIKIYLRGNEVGWVHQNSVNLEVKGNLLIKSSANLRMGPGLDYRIITKIPGGEQTRWLDNKSGWYQIQIPSGEVGWVTEDLIRNVTIPEMTANKDSYVHGGPGTNFERVGEIKKGEKYAPLNKQSGWYQIRLSSRTDGWVPMDVFNVKKSRLVFTLDKADIRKGPGLTYDLLTTVEPATDLTVIGSEGEWYYVELQDGTKGYVKRELVFEE